MNGLGWTDKVKANNRIFNQEFQNCENSHKTRPVVAYNKNKMKKPEVILRNIQQRQKIRQSYHVTVKKITR